MGFSVKNADHVSNREGIQNDVTMHGRYSAYASA